MISIKINSYQPVSFCSKKKLFFELLLTIFSNDELVLLLPNS